MILNYNCIYIYIYNLYALFINTYEYIHRSSIYRYKAINSFQQII